MVERCNLPHGGICGTQRLHWCKRSLVRRAELHQLLDAPVTILSQCDSGHQSAHAVGDDQNFARAGFLDRTQ
jgi:hypothetical protein